MQSSSLSPSIATFGPSCSLNFSISANFARSFLCAGLAWPGTITRAGMSRTNSAFGNFREVSGYSTIVLLWAILVVVLIINGIDHLREYSKASLVKSYASCESAGSRTGSPPAKARERVSCSFWLEAMPGSSATTATIAPCTPLYEAVKKRSWATLKPTCFIVTREFEPAKATPSATSAATFSFGAHSALPPRMENVSRISVDGVPGYPTPSAQPEWSAPSAMASLPLNSFLQMSDIFLHIMSIL